MLLYAKKSGRLELRTGGPAAELIPLRHGGTRREVFRFGGKLLGEVSIGVDLARPLFAGELAEAVDDAVEVLFAAGHKAHVVHDDFGRTERAVEKNLPGHDMSEIKGAASARPGVAKRAVTGKRLHPEVRRIGPEGNDEGDALPSVDGAFAGTRVVAVAIGFVGAVDAHAKGDGLVGRVVEIKGDAAVAAKIGGRGLREVDRRIRVVRLEEHMECVRALGDAGGDTRGDRGVETKMRDVRLALKIE